MLRIHRLSSTAFSKVTISTHAVEVRRVGLTQGWLASHPLPPIKRRPGAHHR
jgi:hypothetical protein